MKHGVAITETLLEYVDALAATGVPAMLDTLYASQSIMVRTCGGSSKACMCRKSPTASANMACGDDSQLRQWHHFDAQIEMMKPAAISFSISPTIAAPTPRSGKYGSEVTLIGHIPPPWLLSATDEEVYEECRREIETFKTGGGYILATGCEYPANLSFDKARIIVDAAKKYGRY